MLTIPSSLFTYDRETRSLVSELSTLQANGYDPLESRHFRVKSAKTGDERQFHFDFADKDPEGDITAWQFLENTATRNGLAVVVYND